MSWGDRSHSRSRIYGISSRRGIRVGWRDLGRGGRSRRVSRCRNMSGLRRRTRMRTMTSWGIRRMTRTRTRTRRWGMRRRRRRSRGLLLTMMGLSWCKRGGKRLERWAVYGAKRSERRKIYPVYIHDHQGKTFCSDLMGNVARFRNKGRQF